MREAGFFFAIKKTFFKSTAAVKQERRLTNPMMACSCRSYCLDLPVVLVDFRVEGCPLRLHRVCQGDYVVLDCIDFEVGERNICPDCVDKLRFRGGSAKLKKVGDSTVSRTDKLEEYKEEVEGTVLVGGVDEVSKIPVVYPLGPVSVS